MPTKVQIILHKATSQNKLNILSYPTHERYQGNMASLDADFWLWRGNGIKNWKNEYFPMPPNHHLLDLKRGDDQVPLWLDLDLIISQNPLAHFNISKSIGEQLELPIISVHHTLPPPNFGKTELLKMKRFIDKSDLHIFISEFNRDAWGYKDDKNVKVIKHGIDFEFWKASLQIERQNIVMSAVNDWINRDVWCGFNLFRQITGFPQNTFDLLIVGDTPGLSKPASNPEDLRNKYSSSRIFLNTSLVSPIPMSLLEAMSCGCACISTNTCMIPHIIKHGENGYIYPPDKPELFQDRIRELLDKPKLCKKIGDNAHQTIVEKFSKEKFVDEWRAILNDYR